jgi:hypothetical protein
MRGGLVSVAGLGNAETMAVDVDGCVPLTNHLTVYAAARGVLRAARGTLEITQPKTFLAEGDFSLQTANLRIAVWKAWPGRWAREYAASVFLSPWFSVHYGRTSEPVTHTLGFEIGRTPSFTYRARLHHDLPVTQALEATQRF